jgi:Endonuclease NucS C-terminal domain
MVEREMQELIWEHAERFLNEPLKQFAWEASSKIGRADLVFEDRLGRLLIIEVKRGVLPRGAIDQLHDYFGMMKQKYPDKAVEMMVIAWAIPQERRLACELYHIDCRELSERFFRDIAAEYGYLFASESQINEKKPDKSISSERAKLTATPSGAMDETGIREGHAVPDQPGMSDKLEQGADNEAEALSIPGPLEMAAKAILPNSKALLLPVLRLLADDEEHSSQEIRERIRVQFNIAPHQLNHRLLGSTWLVPARRWL